MNHDEINAMAREAGFRTGHIDLIIGDPVPFIAPASGTSCIVEVQRFAALVAEKAAAKEREACAQVCDAERQDFGGVAAGPMTTDAGKRVHEAMAAGAATCAAAIRARGQKGGA